MMRNALVGTSKFLSLVLRHQPETIGLTLDANGWTDTRALLQAMQAHGKSIDFATLREIVATNDKKRFEFSPDQARIRACQGHSLPVELALPPRVPPDVLYHGTATHFWDSIREHGLVKGQRQHVHLSPDPETARKVGMRHGKPLILEIQSGAMHRAGYVFYLSRNGVWLTEQVPVECLTLLKA